MTTGHLQQIEKEAEEKRTGWNLTQPRSLKGDPLGQRGVLRHGDKVIGYLYPEGRIVLNEEDQ